MVEIRPRTGKLKMYYRELKHPVAHGAGHSYDSPPNTFLDELVAWGMTAPDEIFESRDLNNSVYAAVFPVLGPYKDGLHRRAVMLEVMRVLAGYESAWKWTEGVDVHPQKEIKDATTSEAGAWQVSANSMNLARELKSLVMARTGSDDGLKFQQSMKSDHALAMEYIARLLRNTIKANGPVVRHTTEIDLSLRRDAVQEFIEILDPTDGNIKLFQGRFVASIHLARVTNTPSSGLRVV